jgi:2'-5' RNA ligase
MTIYYLGIRFDKKTKNHLSRLRSLNTLNDFRMPNLNFHTTIAHSIRPFKIELPKLPQNPIGYTIEARLFGESLVAVYVSDFCQYLHRLTLDGGAKWDHKSFIPHITFAEDIIALNIQDIRMAQLIPIPINISEIFYREWKEKV